MLRQPQDLHHLTSVRACGTKREEGVLRDQDPLGVGTGKAGAVQQELEPLRSSLVVESVQCSGREVTSPSLLPSSVLTMPTVGRTYPEPPGRGPWEAFLTGIRLPTKGG